MESQHNGEEIKLLIYLGKDKRQLKYLIKKQTLINLFMPAFISYVILVFAAPLINYKLNILFSGELKNICLSSISIYTFCFLV